MQMIINFFATNPARVHFKASQLFAIVVFIQLFLPSVCVSQEGELKKYPDGLLNEVYVEKREEVLYTLYGTAFRDFSVVKVKQGIYSEFEKHTHSRKGLESILNRLLVNDQFIAVAAFLNQRYPEHQFDPIVGSFSPDGHSSININIEVDGVVQTLFVPPECVGLIFYSYWSKTLNVGRYRMSQEMLDELEKRRDAKNK